MRVPERYSQFIHSHYNISDTAMDDFLGHEADIEA